MSSFDYYPMARHFEIESVGIDGSTCKVRAKQITEHGHEPTLIRALAGEYTKLAKHVGKRIQLPTVTITGAVGYATPAFSGLIR